MPEVIQEVEIVQKIKTELVDECGKRHRLVVGGRGKGASWSIARILLLRGMERPRFVPCVREVQKTIRHSTKKLLDDTIKILGWEWFYKSTDNEIRGINGTLFAFYGLHDYNADNIKSLEGADDCWVAEAQSMARRSINILRPTIRKDDAVFWWDLNPRYETDPVYVDYIINDDPNAKVCYVNWPDNPWFTKSLEMERQSDYLRDPEEADHIWKGQIWSSGDTFVIPSAILDPAMKRTYDRLGAAFEVGADIAHQGGDEIVFYKRSGYRVIDVYKSRYQDAVTTARALAAFAGEQDVLIKIDNGHVGAAVADILEEMKFHAVQRVNFGGRPNDREHYYDAATEMYFNLRDILQSGDETVDIPNDEELRAQLIQRKYKFVNGRSGYEVMKIEGKDEFVTHATNVNKSPDRADALVLCFYNPDEESDDALVAIDFNIF